jgi:diguanylate cyclase (GGDEF)-like protein
MPVFRSVGKACQHEQRRIGIPPEIRVLLSYVMRTSCHVVRVAGDLRTCKQYFERTRDIRHWRSDMELGRLRPNCEDAAMDLVTGLYTRASVEQWLGKEVARARRHNIPLSLVALHLDDFAQLNQRYGSAAGDLILKEFANRLRKASRGTDFGVRLGSDDFLLVLPECSLTDAKTVSDRLGALAMKCSGQDIDLTFSVGWIDYKPGEVPSDLFKRAGDVLLLYKKASQDSFSTTLVVR